VKPGRGKIIRSSQDSTLTLPHDTWLGIQKNTFSRKYCGCGLPHHLLLPKGTTYGKIHDLFVMLTPSEEGDVLHASNHGLKECQNAPIWCPNTGQKYPDAWPMGYPFDRRPANYLHYLEDFTREYTNMNSAQVCSTAEFYTFLSKLLFLLVLIFRYNLWIS